MEPSQCAVTEKATKAKVANYIRQEAGLGTVTLKRLPLPGSNNLDSPTFSHNAYHSTLSFL